MKTVNLLDYSRLVTGDSKLGFDNIYEGLITHYKQLGFDIDSSPSHEYLFKVPAESYASTTLNYESSGFKGVALKNLPRVISGPEYSVSSIKDGYAMFIQNHPFVFSPDDHPTKFGSRYSSLAYDQGFRDSVLNSIHENTLKVSGKALLLSDDCWSPPNYCHWLFDWFTRLAFVSDFCAPNEPISVLLPAASVAPWVLESIKVFSIFNPRFTFIFLPSNVSVRPAELLVPSTCNTPIPHPANKFSTWAVNFVRDKIKDTRTNFAAECYSIDKQPKKIFIDRSFSSRGSGLVLDSDFDVFLGDYGIQRIALENFSVLDQKKIFENCELVVGLHGAGFTNLAFTHPGTKVIEIFSPEFGSPAYAMLSGKIGLPYSAICGELNDEDVGLDKAWRKVAVSTRSIEEYVLGD